MKIIFFLALFFSVYSYSQEYEGKVTYKVTSNSDAFIKRLNDSILSEQIKNDQIRTFSNGTPIVFHLFINAKEALYKKSHDDKTNTSSGYVMNVTAIMAGEHNVYYTNLETEEKFFKNSSIDDILVNVADVTWELTSEKKEIGEYTCYKAIGNFTSDRHGLKILEPIVAWYTPEVPVSFGIGPFGGLPGLTLELMVNYNFGKVSYKAIQVNFEPKEAIIIEKPTGQKRMSEKEYVEYRYNQSRYR
ncbi:GLPGLI family protein [Ascidiimonas aurantiaca]|uniref:GLPGLI family protein n=1 Tax=Ascidiimonas aurantiaca TaxID=1685432 RepID=UPI0030EF0ABA